MRGSELSRGLGLCLLVGSTNLPSQGWCTGEEPLGEMTLRQQASINSALI